MKNLFILRHAKSSWENPDQNDFDRPLNDRGKKSIKTMGEVLRKQLIIPDLIISSPANRAFSTAKKMAAEINYDPAKIIIHPNIYEADVKTLLKIVNELDDTFNEVFLVGHNPGLTNLCNYLSDAGIDNISTCGIAQINFSFKSWKLISKSTGQLKYYDFPKNND